jgi:hypothetical protein
MRRTPHAYAIVIATLAFLVALPAGRVADAATREEILKLPLDFILPPRLEPGTYQTRVHFVPHTILTVGKGWYGAQESDSGWCVAQGPTRPRWAGATISICLYRLKNPYATAVSRFKSLKTLTPGRAKPIHVGGYPGVAFHAAVRGKSARTPGIWAPAVRPGGQQIFLNVRGKTVLLQIQTLQRATGEALARGFLRTVQFPR